MLWLSLQQFTNRPVITPLSSSKIHQQSFRSLPWNDPNVRNKLFGNRTWPERNFLGDIITSISQHPSQQFREPKMKKTPVKKMEPRVLFQSHHSCVHSREGEGSGCNCEDEDGPETHILFEDEESNSDKVKHQDAHTSAGSMPELNTGASYLSECVASDGEKQLSPMSNVEEKPKNPPVEWRHPFRPRSYAVGRAQASSLQRPSLWAHSCNSSEMVKKAYPSEYFRKTVVVKTEKAEKFEVKEMKYENSNCDNGEIDTSVGSAKKMTRTYSSSDNGSNKSDCGPLGNVFSDSLDDILATGSSSRPRRKKSVKSSDEEAKSCEHRAPDANDIVANASKTEVHCQLCGITLPKPQCFYSLGSLCTDGEICETDSDDINRHPVVDIDLEPPLVESQSHHDTGYTSSENFEDESNLSKELDSVWLQEKRETDSYDGDYESDSEDAGVKPVVMSDDMALKPLASVREPIAIKDYALREWKSDTPTSLAMKKVNNKRIPQCSK